MNSTLSHSKVRRSFLAFLGALSGIFLVGCTTQPAPTAMDVPVTHSTSATAEKPMTAAKLHGMMDRLASSPALLEDHSMYFHKAAPMASSASDFVASNP